MEMTLHPAAALLTASRPAGVSFAKPKMRPVVVVVADVVVHKALQMAFIENDDMVEQITVASPDEAFRNAVLPWTSEAGSFRFDTEALDGIDYVLVEIRSAIEESDTWQRNRRETPRAIAATTQALVGCRVTLK